MAPVVKLGYWKMRGLASVVRMMLEYAEVEYEDKMYDPIKDREEWFDKDKPELLAKNPLANLPYLVDGETVVCQTNAIFLHLGEKFGWNGNSVPETLLILQLLDEIYDLRNEMIQLVYSFKKVSRTEDEYLANANEQISKSCPGYYAKFEKVLERGGKKYFVADTLMTPDFHIWEIIDQYEALARKISKESSLKDFPRLEAFYKAFREEPKLQRYFASEAHTLPINSPAKAWFA